MVDLTDDDLMPFGKHKGVKMANVPAKYLKWAYDSFIVTPKKWNNVYHYIKDNLEIIEKESK